MVVICMNDYPVAVATTERKATEAHDYIQKLWDVMEKAYSGHGRSVYIHVHQVPTVETIEDFHNVFLRKGGNNYQHILNNLMHRVAFPLCETVPIKDPEVAAEMFKNFRKTYPAIDEFIKRAQGAEYLELKPRSEGLSKQEYARMKNQVWAFATDLNHYDSDDFTPPESIEPLLNDPLVAQWLNDMLKNAVSLALSKLEELKDREEAGL